MWQSFLATYGNVPCVGGVDGHFGSATVVGTKGIQGFFGLNKDGVVGYNTWHAASNWLVYNGNDGFITSSYVPYAGHAPYAMYVYVYSGPWQWEATPALPFEADFPTNHPAISFTPNPVCS